MIFFVHKLGIRELAYTPYEDKVIATIWWIDAAGSDVKILDASTSAIPPGATGTISSSYISVPHSSINGPEGIGVYPLFDRDGDGISDLIESTNEESSWWSGVKYFKPTVPDEDPSAAGGTDTLGWLTDGIELPQEGIGYYHFHGYDPPYLDNWGSLKLIKVIEQVGREWNQRHPEGPRIGVGDLSIELGGEFCTWYINSNWPYIHKDCHENHQQGLNADIRLMRSDGDERPYSFNSEPEPYPTFNQVLTQELVDILCESGVELIYRDNRSGLIGSPGCQVLDYPGHADHIHIIIGP